MRISDWSSDVCSSDLGKLLPSAHAVDREFRVISALHGTDVPVARPYVLCEDESIIGQAFYVMEHVRGRVFRAFMLPDLEPSRSEERRVGKEGVRTGRSRWSPDP